MKDFSIQIPDDYFIDKNTLLAYIIRAAHVAVKQTDLPGEMKAFGNETPISTVEMREKLGDMTKANFCKYFNEYKRSVKQNYETTVTPLISFKNGGEVYTQDIFRDFVAFLASKGTHYSLNEPLGKLNKASTTNQNQQ